MEDTNKAIIVGKVHKLFKAASGKMCKVTVKIERRQGNKTFFDLVHCVGFSNTNGKDTASLLAAFEEGERIHIEGYTNNSPFKGKNGMTFMQQVIAVKVERLESDEQAENNPDNWVDGADDIPF